MQRCPTQFHGSEQGFYGQSLDLFSHIYYFSVSIKLLQLRDLKQHVLVPPCLCLCWRGVLILIYTVLQNPSSGFKGLAWIKDNVTGLDMTVGRPITFWVVKMKAPIPRQLVTGGHSEFLAMQVSLTMVTSSSKPAMEEEIESFPEPVTEGTFPSSSVLDPQGIAGLAMRFRT